jgi:catechol 2,3-dioxygenase-like lactoylglutathione lyase family enzyme
MMKSILLMLACASLFAAENLPVSGISHAGFRVADLEKTRAFYTGVLGFQQAFEQKDGTGKITLAVFKINEDEFLEFSPGVPAGTTDRFTHIAFLTDKLESLQKSVERLGFNPPKLRTGRDRTRNFSIKDPDGHRVEFVQYEPDSMHAQARGKFVDNRRISTHLVRVGIATGDRNRALSFYRDSLGLAGYIELLPQGTATRLYFAVPDVKEAARTLHDIHDPDGTPIELVSDAR